MNTTPLVSVIIPTYHRPHLIGRSVASVLRQTVDDLEVLVVIDGTDDGTRSVVENFGDRRARVIESQRNQGPAATRNIGVRNARGDYAGFLDDDDEWMPEKLETQLRLICDRKLTGEFLVACRILAKPTYGSSFILPQRLYQDGQDLSECLSTGNAKTMHRDGQPRLLHWMLIAGVAVLPIGIAEQLRRWIR